MVAYGLHGSYRTRERALACLAAALLTGCIAPQSHQEEKQVALPAKDDLKLLTEREEGSHPRQWTYYLTTDGKVLLHGKWRAWHHNGVLSGEREYAHGKAVGRYRSWYHNGKPCLFGQYRDGKEHSVWTEYHMNGTRSGQWEYGNPNGVETQWDKDGSPRARLQYRGNKPWQGSICRLEGGDQWGHGRMWVRYEYADGEQTLRVVEGPLADPEG